LTQGPFRPGSLNKLKAFFDQERKLAGLYHKIIVPNLSAEKNPLSPQITTDGINKAYQIANYHAECLLVPSTLPVGAFRSVYASTNTFAHECFIDELGHLAKK